MRAPQRPPESEPESIWKLIAQGMVMGLILLMPLFIVGRLVNASHAPTPTMTPLPLPTIITLEPQPTRTANSFFLPTPTPKPFVLPTATPHPDMVMTEIYQSVESGALLAFIDVTPAVKPVLSGTPIALCNPAYRGVCIPSGLTRAFCYDLKEEGFTVVGVDVLHLDRDNDGRACEVYDDWTPN